MYINPEAVAMVRSQLSLNDQPSTWSYEQRQRYNQALAAYANANPTEFAGADLRTLDRIANQQLGTLDDTSFLGSVEMFGNEMLEQVKEKTDLGFGTLRNVLYILAAVGIAVFVFVRFGKK